MYYRLYFVIKRGKLGNIGVESEFGENFITIRRKNRFYKFVNDYKQYKWKGINKLKEFD